MPEQGPVTLDDSRTGPRGRARIALVLSGGGARGAYEAGILHYIRTMLPGKNRQRQFDIHCGASVGAINTAFMAATAHDYELQGRQVWQLWKDVREGDIYRRDNRALLDFIAKTGTGVFLNIFRKPEKRTMHFNGFLDTAPFLPFIKRIIPWTMISKNIAAGLIDAVSIVATNVGTGKMELFIEKSPAVEYTGEYIAHLTELNPLQIMASAAIPIIFPTVMIDEVSYTDGGLRLNTPMSPAIQLGADAILVIGLHHTRHPGEEVTFHGVKGKPPAMGEVLGRVMNSIFLDRTQYDIEQLERINRLIDWAEMLYGENFMENLNDMLLKKKIRGDIANRGLKRLKVFRISPSVDIGELFSECYRRGRNVHFTAFEKMLVRVLDIDPTGGNDFLSYLTFMPEYLEKLLELGFEDARRQHNDLKTLMEL